MYVVVVQRLYWFAEGVGHWLVGVGVDDEDFDWSHYWVVVVGLCGDKRRERKGETGSG